MIKKFTIGKYKDLNIPMESIKVLEIEIDEIIEDIRKLHSSLAEKTTQINKADHATINYKCTCDGEIVQEATKDVTRLKIGGGSFDSAFEQQLIGLSKGDSKTFAYKTDKNFIKEELVGKTVEFEVEVLKVEEAVMPEFDEAFILELGEDHIKTKSDLIDIAKNELIRRKTLDQQVDVLNNIMKNILDSSIIEYDLNQVEETVEESFKKACDEIEAKGYTMQIYLEHEKYENADALKAEIREEFKTQLLEKEALDAICTLENIVVDESEYLAVLNRYLSSNPKDFETFDDHDEFKKSLLYKKALDYLVQVNTK